MPSGRSLLTIQRRAMPAKLGIGITTFNRCRKLEVCISRLQELTAQPFQLVVADDGSTDATGAICAQRELISVTGANIGIAGTRIARCSSSIASWSATPSIRRGWSGPVSAAKCG